MTSREFQDVVEMTKTPHWRVFESFVVQKQNDFFDAALQPVENESDVFACERAKSAGLVLKELVNEFRSFLTDELKRQQEKENANSV